ncbi:MAG: hypothetical protein GJ680_06850 [Alteromonadaceae bacterium]|nr:hypothetical protein [Alteromonadaceae bacterium]
MKKRSTLGLVAKQCALLIFFSCSFAFAENNKNDSFAEDCEAISEEKPLAKISALLMDDHGQNRLVIGQRAFMIHLITSSNNPLNFHKEELKSLLDCETGGRSELAGDLFKLLVFKEPTFPTLSPEKEVMFYKLITALAYIQDNHSLFTNSLVYLESLVGETEMVAFLSDMYLSILYEPTKKVCQLHKKFPQRDVREKIDCKKALSEYENPLVVALKSRYFWLDPLFFLLDKETINAATRHQLLYQQAVLKSATSNAQYHFNEYLRAQLKQKDNTKNIDEIVKLLMWRYQLNYAKYDLAPEIVTMAEYITDPKLITELSYSLESKFRLIDKQMANKVTDYLATTNQLR